MAFIAMAAASAAAAICTIAGCAPTNSNVAPAVKAPCEGIEVTVAWDEPTTCDVTPPQRLNLDYGDMPYAQWSVECANSGGFESPNPDASICQDVDY